MRYTADLDGGLQLIVENDDGESTLVTLSNSSEGQQQSQRIGFHTGEWASAPALFRLRKDHVLRVNTAFEVRFIAVHGNQVRSLQGAPYLEDAEEIPMTRTEPGEGQTVMKPMRPMSPMKPMEMRLGNMQMSMGSEDAQEQERRFCTQCGQPVGKGDRFCAYCGAKLQTGSDP